MKEFFLLLFFVISLTTLQAQKNETRFGIGAGVNIANITVKEPGGTISPHSVAGFKGYIFLDAPIGGSFSIQPELSFDGLGWQYDGQDNSNGGNQSNVKSTMNYFFISVLPKYTVPNTGLGFYAGPSYGFLLSAKAKGYQGTITDVKDIYTPGDFAATIGAEYYFSFGLGISARYLAGISNIAKDHEDGESVHNHAITFTLAYKFGR